MARYDLSDEEWTLIQDLFPENVSKRGRPWRDHRTIMSGIIWVLRSGAPWRDLPTRYGIWQTVYDRFARYQREGVLDQILQRLQLALDENGRIDWTLGCIDGTHVRAHRSAAGALKKSRRTKNRQITH